MEDPHESVVPICLPSTEDLESISAAERHELGVPLVDPVRHLAWLDHVHAQLVLHVCSLRASACMCIVCAWPGVRSARGRTSTRSAAASGPGPFLLSCSREGAVSSSGRAIATSRATS